MPHDFLGYNVEVPFGPAAGAINGANAELLVLQARRAIMSPVGAVWIGSMTMLRSQGNDHYGRTYYHKPSTGETVNSLGLPNIGREAVLELIPDLARLADDQNKPLIVSGSPAKGEDPREVLPQLMYDFLMAGAHGVEANYSCPNKITDDGGREPILGYDPDMVGETREAILAEIGTDAPFIEKWSPPIDIKESIFRCLAVQLHDVTGVRYVSGPNAIPNVSLLDETDQPALDVPGNLGGASGPVHKDFGRASAIMLRTLLPESIGVISSLGVMDGAEVYHRVHRDGAVMTNGVTLYFENEAKGRDYGQTGTQIAEEYAAAASGSW